MGFVLANWRWLLPTLGLLGALVWGGLQHLDRLEAEKALVEQQRKTLQDANDAWRELNGKREAFEREVRDGLGKLNATLDGLHLANRQFQERVRSNANSNRALDPAERDALGLLAVPRSADGEPPGGRALRPADPPPRVR